MKDSISRTAMPVIFGSTWWQSCFLNWAQNVSPQAAAAKEVLDARWRGGEAEHCAKTGAQSLPPRWFVLRSPDGLQRPHGEGLRFRHARLLSLSPMPLTAVACTQGHAILATRKWLASWQQNTVVCMHAVMGA